jgi:hypothetical protein
MAARRGWGDSERADFEAGRKTNRPAAFRGLVAAVLREARLTGDVDALAVEAEQAALDFAKRTGGPCGVFEAVADHIAASAKAKASEGRS